MLNLSNFSPSPSLFDPSRHTFSFSFPSPLSGFTTRKRCGRGGHPPRAISLSPSLPSPCHLFHFPFPVVSVGRTVGCGGFSLTACRIGRCSHQVALMNVLSSWSNGRRRCGSWWWVVLWSSVGGGFLGGGSIPVGIRRLRGVGLAGAPTRLLAISMLGFGFGGAAAGGFVRGRRMAVAYVDRHPIWVVAVLMLKF